MCVCVCMCGGVSGKCVCVCTCVVCMPATLSKVKLFGSGLQCTVRLVPDVTSRQATLSSSDSSSGSGGLTLTYTRTLSPALHKRGRESGRAKTRDINGCLVHIEYYCK